ncbi:MAG: hypothetical protein PHE33_12810 [Bacteroidales bacterium]|nr:hypothetical protein [Bacteroidales bacterium]
MQKENRNIWRTFNIYYRYTRKSGLLSFVISNLVKVAAIIAVVILAVWILNSFIIQVSDIPRFLIENFRTEVVLLFFLFTESFLGLIPPDFFILWVSEMSNFYLWVGLLGLLSYVGGFFAYYLGFAVSKLPKWKNRLLKFYAKHLDNIKKWGVVFIIIAALFPLPYATVCTLAGILRFPLRRLGYIGLFRIARFFIYAPIVAGLV